MYHEPAAQHHGTHRLFPGNGGWDGKQTILSVNGTPPFVYTTEANNPKPHFWGVGDPARGPKDQTGSWAYAILPYVVLSGPQDFEVTALAFSPTPRAM